MVLQASTANRGAYSVTKVSFSDLRVKRLRAPEKGQKRYWDATLPGFGLRVSQGGSKTWIIVDPRSRTRTQETIGRYPVVSLGEARGEARRRLAEVTLGRYRPVAMTWEAATVEYLDEVKRTRKERTYRDYKRMLDVHFKFRTTRLSEIRPLDIQKRLAKLHDRPSEHHHAFTVARTFFTWAYRKSYVADHPMGRMKAPPISAPRERILTDEEIGKVWNACEGDNFGRLVKALLLTGQRRGEIAGPDRYIDGDTLVLPETKNGREHRIPITPLAKSLIEAGTSWSGFSKSKVELDRRAGVTGWTLHDLRRTFASGMAGIGVGLPVIEKMLNHVSGASFGGVAGVYQRYNYAPEMREALTKWEEHVCGFASATCRWQSGN